VNELPQRCNVERAQDAVLLMGGLADEPANLVKGEAITRGRWHGPDGGTFQVHRRRRRVRVGVD